PPRPPGGPAQRRRLDAQGGQRRPATDPVGGRPPSRRPCEGRRRDLTGSRPFAGDVEEKFGNFSAHSALFLPKPHGLRTPRDMKMGPVRPSSGELGAVSPIPKLSGGLLSTTNCCFEHVGQLC